MVPILKKLLSNNFQDLSFHPGVPSIATYNNYNQNRHCAKGSFTFCKGMQGVSNNVMIIF